MAIIEQPPGPLQLAPAGGATPTTAMGVFRRPVATTGWRAWAFTVDHKKLGIMYGVTAFVFFLIGGFEALLIRLQLMQPDGKVLSASVYNQMFTMHATTMVFLFVMPMAAAFANYFLPLQIGARDVAFPASTRSASGRSCSAACCSTRRGCWAAAPTVAGSCTRPTRVCSSRPATASTSG
jgi:cytochrome c oxidase subunit 1